MSKKRPALTDIMGSRQEGDRAEESTSHGPGRPKKANSLRAQVRRGEAKHLRAIIPTDLFERLEREAFEEKTTISELVAEALRRRYEET